MSQPFLTLEGVCERRRRCLTLGALMGVDEDIADLERRLSDPWIMNVPGGVQPSKRRDAEARLVELKRKKAEEDAKQKTEEATFVKRFYQPSNYELEQKGKHIPSVFSQYGFEKEGLMSLYDDDGDYSLKGFSFKRAFTPPRAVRRAVSSVGKAISAPFKKFATYLPQPVRKGFRYLGAGTAIMYGGAAFMGKARNKAFGLSPGEQKKFDAASKVHRAGSIAVATIATASMASGAGAGQTGGLWGAGTKGIASWWSGAGAKAATPAVQNTMGPAGSRGLMSWLSSAKGSSWLANAKSGAALVMKSADSNSFFKMAMTTGGQMLISKFTASQAPAEDYNALPNNEPVPVGYDSQPDPAPMVGGSSGLTPGGAFDQPRQLGDDRSYPREESLLKDTAQSQTNIDPESDAGTSPMQDQLIRDAWLDDVTVAELIKRGKSPDSPASIESRSGFNEGESLRGFIRRSRRGA